MNETTILISEHNAIRLDVFLKNSINSHSRTFFAKIIDSGLVKLNGKIAQNSSQIVMAGDEVEVSFPQPIKIDQSELNQKLDIIFDHEDFLAINKPAGLLTHKAASSNTLSISEILSNQMNLSEEFNDQDRPGIIHRLDKDTSGILLVAKNAKGFNQLSKIFQSRGIKKAYLTVAKGACKENKFVIDKCIGRSPKNPILMQIDGINRKDAKSIVTVLDSNNDYHLLQVEILTGRTHQIRVHLQSEGLLVVGDDKYGFVDQGLISRQALHAAYVEFQYEGKSIKLQSHLPEDFNNLLNKLNLKNPEKINF